MDFVYLLFLFALCAAALGLLLLCDRLGPRNEAHLPFSASAFPSVSSLP
jgi:hypothetical protein